MNFLKEYKKYLVIALLTIFVIFSTIVFFEIIRNGGLLVSKIDLLISLFLQLLSPFIIGYFIAFMLNAPSKRLIQSFDNNNIFNKKRRTLYALLITYFIFFGFLFVIIRLIIPTILTNVYDVINELYFYLSNAQENINEYLKNNTGFLSELINFVNKYTDNMLDSNNLITIVFTPIINLVSNFPHIISELFSSIMSIVSVLFDSILAVMVSFYLLMDKQFFINYGRRISFTLFKEKRSERILYVASVTNRIFEKFLIGKALDSLIIGSMFFVICYFLGVPYNLLFSVIIGITNMIPYFGPFIGAIPVVSILLITNFRLAFIVAIVILILQQFDGNYLGPKILGKQTGVRPIGIIFAVTIGGRLFGAIGMLLGVPVLATLSFFFNEYVNKKYDKKVLLIEDKEYTKTKKEKIDDSKQ